MKLNLNRLAAEVSVKMQMLNAILLQTEQRLKAITQSWHSESRMILCHVLKCEPIDLVLSKNRILSDLEMENIEEIVSQRLLRKPLQYLLGVQNFYGLDFYVNPNVLIPRPETECLVTFIIEQAVKSEGKILDIGVGSGAIVVSLAHRLKGYSFVGSDISEEALNVAKSNGEIHGVNERIKWVKSDLFQTLSHEKFDIIVSNPPYIPVDDAIELEPEVSNCEPHIALFGGDDGLDLYRKIIPGALKYLMPGGILAFEAGHNQHEAIESIFKANGYVEIDHFCDLNGIPRFIHGRKLPIGG